MTHGYNPLYRASVQAMGKFSCVGYLSIYRTCVGSLNIYSTCLGHIGILSYVGFVYDLLV